MAVTFQNEIPVMEGIAKIKAFADAMVFIVHPTHQADIPLPDTISTLAHSIIDEINCIEEAIYPENVAGLEDESHDEFRKAKDLASAGPAQPGI